MKRLLLLLAMLPPVLAQAEMRDPTAPSSMTMPGKHNPSGPGWELHSTLINGQRRVAVINGKPVLEGERIDDARVVSIRPNEVLLETAQRRITLLLIPRPLRSHTQP